MKALLKLILLSLMGYFLAMSVAHFIGYKVPLLFIYYDVPSEPYQDKIISFCAFAYAMFAFAAIRARAAVIPFILAMSWVVVGLSLVNLSSSLREVIGHDASTAMYWAQTGFIGFAVVFLCITFLKSK